MVWLPQGNPALLYGMNWMAALVGSAGCCSCVGGGEDDGCGCGRDAGETGTRD